MADDKQNDAATSCPDPTPDGRGPDGRFKAGWKGGPGNPHVRRLAYLQAAVHDAIDPRVLHGIVRKLAVRALEGDVGAAKVVLERVCGKPRTEQPEYAFELPPIETAADLPAAFQRVAQGAASGEIPIDDAARFAGVLELARRAIETSALADRVAQLEAHLGDRNLRPVL